MKKKVFLIHGWGGTPNEGWRPWLKKELEKRGFQVFVPAMPETHQPKMSSWVGHLRKIVGKPDKNSYFVGHSLGCVTILRYLEGLNFGEKVGGAILVAGFTSNLGCEELNSFFQKPIQWEKIRLSCPKFVAIFSDNDPYVSLHYGEFFRLKLGAEIIVKHKMKHFSGDDGIFRLPVVLEKLLAIAK